MTGDITFWRGYGYADQLKDTFTVILFDARGHGQSDKPHEAAAYDYQLYDYQLMGGDVLAILDALEIIRANYWGYSMGGFIGLGLAKHYPERLISLISGGADPYYSAAENEEPTPLLQIFRRGVTEATDVVVDGIGRAIKKGEAVSSLPYIFSYVETANKLLQRPFPTPEYNLHKTIPLSKHHIPLCYNPFHALRCIGIKPIFSRPTGLAADAKRG